jgi:hypothetical protein
VVARVASARALLLPVNLCCGATGISDQKYALGALGWGVAQMLSYRVYVVDAEGHVLGPPYIVQFGDDDEAVRQARQYVDGKPVEVWLDAKRLARLEREQ